MSSEEEGCRTEQQSAPTTVVVLVTGVCCLLLLLLSGQVLRREKEAHCPAVVHSVRIHTGQMISVSVIITTPSTNATNDDEFLPANPSPV